jgi:hypothetical protein
MDLPGQSPSHSLRVLSIWFKLLHSTGPAWTISLAFAPSPFNLVQAYRAFMSLSSLYVAVEPLCRCRAFMSLSSLYVVTDNDAATET